MAPGVVAARWSAEAPFELPGTGATMRGVIMADTVLVEFNLMAA